ncbi:MAG: hypothetical protein WC810_27895, partial [Janthinobacterium sp.]
SQLGDVFPAYLPIQTQHRTAYLSEHLSLIILINNQLQGVKKGEKLSFDNLSPLVAQKGNSLNT